MKVKKIPASTSKSSTETYANSLQASINECLVKNISTVGAELEVKLKARQQTLKKAKTMETKIRLA